MPGRMQWLRGRVFDMRLRWLSGRVIDMRLRWLSGRVLGLMKPADQDPHCFYPHYESILIMKMHNQIVHLHEQHKTHPICACRSKCSY